MIPIEQINRDKWSFPGGVIERLIAFATKQAPYVPPTQQQIKAAAGDDCYELCGRKAELGSSRCAVCGPAARDRAQDRQTRADTARERLAGFC